MTFYIHRGTRIRSLESDRRFNPSLLSNEELEFVSEHLGESPGASMKEGTPDKVNEKTVRPILEFFFELIESETVMFCGVEEFRERLKPWISRQELVLNTAQHNHGAIFDVEMFAKQGSKYVRGGRGSDFGMVRRYGFDFIDDAMPGTLEDSLAAMADTAKANLEIENVRKEEQRQQMLKAEAAGVLKSDARGPEGLLFDDSEPGRLKCVVPDCGYQADYNVVEGEDGPRRTAMRAMYLHCANKAKANDLDTAHQQLAYGMKQG